ncbi:kinectin-like [Drosophila madeirensis]|uniref:Kinectin-like n=1 Tax=Drosophila madeirensis TaxID=30013 RepID=A0AAU9G5V3_DROMD
MSTPRKGQLQLEAEMQAKPEEEWMMGALAKSDFYDSKEDADADADAGGAATSSSCSTTSSEFRGEEGLPQQAAETLKQLEAGQQRLGALEEQLQQAFRDNGLELLQEDEQQLELEQLTRRYNALESDFGATVLKRDARIRELTGCLDLAQGRCEEVQQENERQLQNVRQLQSKILAMEHTNDMLANHFEGAQLELASIDDLLRQSENQQLLGDRIGLAMQRPQEQPSQGKTEDFGQLLAQRTKELGQLAVLSADKARLEQRLANVQRELALKASNYATLEEQIQPLVDALKEQRQKSEKSQKRVQLELGQVKSDKEQLKAELEQLKQENWRLATKRDSSDALRLELQRVQMLLDQAQAEVERLSKLQADTIHDKDILSYELGQRREECAALKSSLRVVEQNSEQLVERLRGERHSLELELQSLQAKMAEEISNLTCSKCVEQLEEIRKLQKLSKRQAKALKETKLKAPQAKHSEDASERQEDLAAQLRGKAEELKAYIKASQCPTQSGQQCNEPLEQQQKSGERMAAQSNMFHAQLQQAAEKYKRLKSSYQKVRAELEKRQYEIQQLQQAAEKHQRMESSYQKVCGELEKRQYEIEQLQQAAEEHQRMESSYQEMCAELEKRQYEIEQLKQAAEKHQREESSYEGVRGELEKQQQQAADKHQRMQSSYQKVCGELEKRLHEIQQLKQAAEKHQRLKSSYQKVCAELEKRQYEIQQLQQAAEKHQREESSYEGVRGELEKQQQQAAEKHQRMQSSYQKVCGELEKRLHEIQQLKQAAEKHQRMESSYQEMCAELEKRQYEIEQLQQAAEKHQREESSYQKVCGELEKRLSEIQQLKHTIVDVVTAKNSELNALVSKCRDGEQCIDELKRGFDEKRTNLDSERRRMKQVLAQWEAQKGEVKQLKKHWEKKLSAVQHEHQQKMDSLNERYQDAMQTLQDYKRYAEDRATEYEAMKKRLAKHKRRDPSAHRQPREQQQ